MKLSLTRSLRALLFVAVLVGAALAWFRRGPVPPPNVLWTECVPAQVTDSAAPAFLRSGGHSRADLDVQVLIPGVWLVGRWRPSPVRAWFNLASGRPEAVYAWAPTGRTTRDRGRTWEEWQLTSDEPRSVGF